MYFIEETSFFIWNCLSIDLITMEISVEHIDFNWAASWVWLTAGPKEAIFGRRFKL